MDHKKPLDRYDLQIVPTWSLRGIKFRAAGMQKP